MLYAKSTRGFYDPIIHAENIPPDAVEIDAETYNALLTGQASGQEIAPNAEGRPVLSTPPPVTATASVSPWQIRKAINSVGLRADVESAIKLADIEMQDAWQYALEFRRDNPLVANLSRLLDKSDAEIDALFELAAGL